MLSACRNDWFWIKVILLALAGMLALASLSTGDGQVISPPSERSGAGEEGSAIESNTRIIRRDLAAGAVVVALGTEMDIMEHRGLIESLKSPDCAGIDDPVGEELLALRGALKAELTRHMSTEVQRMLQGLTKEKLLDALTRAATTDAPASFGFDEFRVEVGFATYSYWQARVRPNQEKGLLREKGERTIVLPNTKQAYVRLTLRVPSRVRL
jgi:hypothetical protein